MKAVINQTHPRKVIEKDGKKQYVKYPVCKTHTGMHCLCFPRWRKNDIQEFGIGLVLYFRFIKFLIYLFAWCTLLSIPSFIFFGSAYLNRVNADGSEALAYDRSFQSSYLFLTMGALGESQPTCSSAVNNGTHLQFKLYCQ